MRQISRGLLAPMNTKSRCQFQGQFHCVIGLSENGFAPVHWHLDSKQTTKEKWSQEVRNGALTAALRSLNPKIKTGTSTILCDGESFLQADMSMSAYRSKRIQLWVVPPKSPGLNPVEMFWSWLRKKLRLMDLADLRAKRRALGKTAYVQRVKGVIRSQKAQAVARKCAAKFRKTCKQIFDRGGAAADN